MSRASNTQRRKSGSKKPGQSTQKPITTPQSLPTPAMDAGIAAHNRQTLPTNANILGSFPYAFLPRRQYQSVDLSTINVSTLSPQQVIDLLSDADPDVSLAWWNFLLLSCGRWKVKAKLADGTDDAPGNDVLNDVIERVNKHWGGFQNLIYQWTMSILLEGACCGETIPTDDFSDVYDIVSVTPWSIYFQRDARQDLIVYQWQPMIANGLVNVVPPGPPTIEKIANASYGAAGFRLLNTETFGYVPFMPMVDDPYGRMPFASVFQIIVFDNQLLQDLRRWAHVNAWGRIDVSVLQERVQALMPPAVQANFPDAIKFVNQYLKDVASSYNNVGPDDTFIHYDNVHVGSVDSAGKTMQIDQLIRAVERKKFRSLRMLPILMGSNESVTETHGTVQWDIMTRGIQSIQTCVGTLVNTLMTCALRLRGSTSKAVIEFESLRTTDRLADAQTEGLEIKNAAEKRDQGWITQDEAANEITGRNAVGPAPDPDSMVAKDFIPSQETIPPTEPEKSEDSDSGNDVIEDGEEELAFIGAAIRVLAEEEEFNHVHSNGHLLALN